MSLYLSINVKTSANV